jgi:CPA2 family monovalent cation:H+ antiporter-2
MPEATLSVELAVTAAAALVGGVLARALRQSTLVGYIAAGVALSPFTPGPVTDVATIERLADIGVVLLMFGIGVHFSLRDLVRVRVVGLGAAVQIAATTALGLAAALAVGWSWREGLYFGAAAAMSGGTVLTKMLADQGGEDTQHARVAIAWSVLQDVSTVVLVVLLGALAATEGRLLPELATALAKAAGFVGGMIVVGARVLPWVLTRVARLGSRELFILSVAGLSLGTAVLSERFGLSLALGAFIAGVVVSESDISYHALGEVLPLREIFAALFFVSVGMLVNPRLIAEHPLVFAVLVVVILSKGLLVAGLSLALRYPAHTAALAGIGLAQSAEFSFVLARQGVAAGVVSQTAFSLILAATASTIVLVPLLYRLAPALERALSRIPLRDPRAPLPATAQPPWRNHVVICGAGRVGGMIAAVLRQRGFGYVIIELDRRLVETLRAAGEPVIYGNAANPPVLEQAALERARTLVVAIPDPVVTRQVIHEARRRNPRLDIVARAVSVDDADALRAQGVAEAVVAERELALEMTRHTLHRVGLTTIETQAILQRLRFGQEPSEL